MTDKAYNHMHEMVMQGAGWAPNNQKAQDLLDQSSPGEIAYFKEVTDRDIPFHRCYFSLLNYIWSYMPDNFKARVQSDKFYLWLKHLRGEYDVIFEYDDGTKCIEYHSVSFGRMSQFEFESFVREQMPWIYQSVIGLCYDGEQFDQIIENIEDDYSTFFSKL